MDLISVRLFCNSFAPRACGSALIPPGRNGGRSLRTCRRRRIEPSSLECRGGSPASPWWNLSDGCWRRTRLTAASSSGKKGKNSSSGNGSRKSKDGTEKKDDIKKDDLWSSGFATDQARPRPEKKLNKKHKQNVWNSDSSSGKSASSSQQQQQRSSSSNDGKGVEGGGGAHFKSPRGRINVALEQDKGSDGRLQPLVESSNAATTNAEQKKKQQFEDIHDTTFLRFLSPILPIEEETLLQPEEPVPNPVWTTFCSSTSGVWRGVGATFSPITGEFEPIYLNEKKQYVYDARVLSTVEMIRTSEAGLLLPPEQQSLHRRVLWSLENFLGEHDEGTVKVQDDDTGGDVYDEETEMGYWEDDEDTGGNEEDSEWEYVLADPGEMDERWENGAVMEELEVMEEIEEDTSSIPDDGTEWRSMWDGREVLDGDWEGGALPFGESEINLITVQKAALAEASTPSTSTGPSYGADLTPGTTWTDVIEEDHMIWEPGLVFFEDGAYSRGPLELTTDASTSGDKGLNAYTFKIEQCLVAGGHKRLRIVHTVTVEDGEKIEILRVVVYEEEWMGPSNMKFISDAGGHQLKLFSERARHSPEDLVGLWKVFEVEGMAIHPGKSQAKEPAAFVFSCKEISIKRGFPVMPKLTLREDKSVDMSDFSMSWLTGNVSAYVNVDETGAFTFGVGWICENGTRLVMERVYGEDGSLVHVNSKSEIKSCTVG